MTDPTSTHPERPIRPARGTRVWLPDECRALDGLESLLLDRFSMAGYNPIRTPVLEPIELHERKSGAGIVSKLYELSVPGSGRLCLRPELTAGIVLAYATAADPPPIPWRVAHSGPVFRFEEPRPGYDREFHQVGVEVLGGSGPEIDGELIWLADWALREAGVEGATIRLGHVGLILEVLANSGLPEAIRASLVERLSDAAAEGGEVAALEQALARLSGLSSAEESIDEPPSIEGNDGVDRLFRTLVPVVTGRRSSLEIVGRLRRKWDLGHSLQGALDRVRSRVRALSEMKGRPDVLLDILSREHESVAPESLAALRGLVESLGHYGVDPSRIELDLGFSRGIGFYSRMVFSILAPSADGPVEVCGGGRYDGLARVLGTDRDDRGAGFAFGLERLQEVLKTTGPAIAKPAPDGFLVLATSDSAIPPALRLSAYLRTEGGRVVLDTQRSISEALDHARESAIGHVIAVSQGDDPMGILIFHDPARDSQVETTARELRNLLRSGGRPRARS